MTFRIAPVCAFACALALGLGCTGEFESCETLRTCGELGDAAPDAFVSGAGGRRAGTGGSPATSGGRTASSGGGDSSGGSGVPPGVSGGAGGALASFDAGASDAGGGPAEGGTDAAIPRDGSAESDAGVRCPSGQKACGALGCVDFASDPDHCGDCSASCGTAGTSRRACVAGACQPTCDAEHVDCNEEGRDGCEVDLRTDPDNCGTCGARCSERGVAGAGRVCSGGVCKPVCLSTHRDCNGVGSDGCEIDVRTDEDHCGACLRECSSASVATRSCVAGLCESSCAVGRGNCNKPAASAQDDGCERDLTRATDCGACGHSCQGSICAQLLCQASGLVTGLTSAGALAATDEHVYYSLSAESIDAGSLFRVPFLGGEPEELFRDEALNGVNSIVTDGNVLYFSQSYYQREGIFRSTGATFQSAETFLDRDDIPNMSPWAMTWQGGHLYWADIILHRVYDAPLSGAAAPIALTPPAGSAIPSDVVVDAEHAYYVLHDSVRRVRLAGGASPEIIPGSTNSRAALSATHVYYTGIVPGGAGLPQYQLLRLPKSLLGTPEFLGLVAAPPSVILTHGAFVYFGLSDGIYRVPQTGGTPLRVATQVNAITQMVEHRGVLFWTNFGAPAGTGSVYRMVLPPP